MIDMAAVAIFVIGWWLVSVLAALALGKVISIAKRNNGENDGSERDDS